MTLPNNVPYRILLADDHHIILDGLTAIISSDKELEIIGKASNGKEALQQIHVLKPDMIILDIDMPIKNGIITAQEIIALQIPIKIIMLSLHKENAVVKNLMQLGVDGYLIKNADSQEMIYAIHQIRNGKKYFSSELLIELSKVSTNSISHDAEKISLLTEREIEIIKLIVEGLSSKEIGEKLFISDRTVETHRNNLMKKLELKNVVGLLRWAIKNGIE